jgi:triosephosphate isomerase
VFAFRKPLIAANWKMYKTVNEALEFVKEFLPLASGVHDIDIAVCPPFTSLLALSMVFKGSPIKLGAQDVFWESQGAYTGEISPAMLMDLGCQYVIVGHSERRHILGESDLIINRKLINVCLSGMTPIFCVGETLQEREDGLAREVVQKQLAKGLQGITPREMVIAYEPVWAIGTGVNASPADAREMTGFIREFLAILYDKNWAEDVLILYGGSVKPDNIAHFMAEKDVDGALVGGASLNAVDFARIVRLNRNV